jgi:alcohol dehydrogenase class IV
LDALTHAIESYISLDANPITSLLSLQAIELITRNLPTATFEGDNLQARSAMSLASMMAGISIANAGTCSGHAAAYGFATRYRIPHGISVAVALPYILKFNLAILPEKAEAIAKAMGVTPDSSSPDAATCVGQSVVSLMKKVECPVSLSQLGVPKMEITNIARNMLKMTRLMVHNPRSMSESDAVDVITEMWEGSIG